MSRVEDVLHADYVAQNPSQATAKKNGFRDSSPVTESESFSSPREDMENVASPRTPSSMTLSDFMGWSLDQGDANLKKDLGGDELLKEGDGKHTNKFFSVGTPKKFSYIEKLERAGGLRSPTARH